MLLYLDLCCLNRPFDDQGQERIQAETRSVLVILERITAGTHGLCDSVILRVENDRNPKDDCRDYAAGILKRAVNWVPESMAMKQRAAELRALGFRLFDAHHTACAEIAGCDCLVTCDDQFLKVAKRNASRIRVRVVDPVRLAGETGF